MRDRRRGAEIGFVGGRIDVVAGSCRGRTGLTLNVRGEYEPIGRIRHMYDQLTVLR